MSEGSKMIKRVCKCLLKITGAVTVSGRNYKDGRLERTLRVWGWTWRYELRVL